jgi:hypothetical protein
MDFDQTWYMFSPQERLEHLWPWKSTGFQILLRTKYVPSLVKIHWRMLILECSQGCYGRTDGSVTISLRMHITNIDVMSEKHWCHKCRCHVWKTLMSLMYVSCLKKTTSTFMTSAFLRLGINIYDMCISDMTSTFMTSLFFRHDFYIYDMCISFNEFWPNLVHT